MRTQDPSVTKKIGIAVFRDWVMASVAPPSLHEDMLARVEHFGSEDLAEMIDIVRQAELSCLAHLGEFHRNTRLERQRQASGRHRRPLGVIVYAEVAGVWDQKIKWLQEVRQCLIEEQKRCENMRLSIG